MFVTLEGPDGSGKSTLAEVLAGRLQPVTRLHHGVPERHALEELELPIQWYVPGRGPNLLTDRWYWSQYVYGPIYRNFNDYPGALGTHRHIELFLRSRGNVTALLLPPVEVCLERATARGEEDSAPKDRGFLDQLSAVHAGYARLFSQSSVESCRIDTSVIGIDLYPEVATDLLHAAEAAEARVRGISLFPTYIGGHTPHTLLLGDCRPAGRQSAEHVAAFAPYPDSSGRYLMSSLPHPWWQGCGIVNLNDPDSPPLGVLWETLGEPRVVALGRNAYETASETFGAHELGAAPHPQYWRRFHHWEPVLYGSLILGAAQDRLRTFSWPIGNEIPGGESE